MQFCIIQSIETYFLDYLFKSSSSSLEKLMQALANDKFVHNTQIKAGIEKIIRGLL